MNPTKSGRRKQPEERKSTADATGLIWARAAAPKGKRPLLLNIEKSNAGRSLMEAIIDESKGKYEETAHPDNSDFKWVAPSNEDSDTYNILSKQKDRVINRYPSIKELGHKDTF